MKVFVGGSRKISKINELIRSRLENMVEKGFSILVGDANGADKTLQKYFFESGYKFVTVFFTANNCRNNIGNWPSISVEAPSKIDPLKFYMLKDKRMSEEADYGFMLWDGSSPGTLNNILNLLSEGRTTVVYFSPKRSFSTIKTRSNLTNLLSMCQKEDIETFNRKISLEETIRAIFGPKQNALPIS